MGKYSRLIVACAIVSSALGARVQAAFINGVERFDGTTLDLNTWERANPATDFTQNNALLISGDGSYADYTTRSVTVGIGQRVTAEVTLTVPPETSTFYAAGLLLTTNSGGTTTDTFRDSRYFGCQIVFDTTFAQDSRHFEAISGGPTGYGFVERGEGVPVSGQMYLLSVARLSPQNYEIGASRTDGTPIFTFSSSFADPIPPDDLYLSLHRTNLRFALNCAATYDNVAVTPEPGFVGLAIGVTMLFARSKACASQSLTLRTPCYFSTGSPFSVHPRQPPSIDLTLR